MNKVLANVVNDEIVLSGYLTGGNVVFTKKGHKIDVDYATSISEFEISSLHQSLCDQLNTSDFSKLCLLVRDGIEVDLSTKIDLEELIYDLKNEGEAKINATGESQKQMASLVAEIRKNVDDNVEIFIDTEKSRKGYESTYIRIYA